MSDLPINQFDLAVIGIVAISTLIAFARGFVREFLSVSAFVAAALAALWASPAIVPSVRGFIQPDWLAFLVVVVGVFLTVFVGVTMITHSLTSLLHNSDNVGFFDRVLGLGFGAARGVLLAALFVILYSAAFAAPSAWMVNGASYPLVARTAQALQSLAPASAPIAANPVPDPGVGVEG